jgi:hypothetical protein
MQKYYSKELNGSFDSLGYYGELLDLPDKSKDPIFFERRRHAICYLFESMGSPEESLWENEGIISDLMIRLNINRNSRSRVMDMLRDVLNSHELGTVYQPCTNNQQRGRHARIIEHVAMTAALLPGDKKKFQLGIPNHVWSAMERCWNVCEPTSERIVPAMSPLKFSINKL